MPDPQPSVEMYPSAQELFDTCHTPLPPDLTAEICRRYDLHGMEYATELYHTDGRIVNGCMEMDSLESAREELVDATFNLLVANFKQGGGMTAAGTIDALIYVKRAWETLSALGT